MKVNNLMSVAQELYERYKFDPLHYEDGRPCYFRASCLALFAISLIAHVVLKVELQGSDNDSLMAQSAALDVNNNAVIVSNNNAKQNLVQGSIDLRASNNEVAISNAVAPTIVKDHVNAATLIANNQTKGDLKVQNSDTQSLADTQNEIDVWDEDDSSWSLFGFSSDESKQKKALIANRKQALSELSDGAAFLSACGNINASFKKCRFSFSNKVKSNYESKVEAKSDSFNITLIAKGAQQKDPCNKFVVNSKGDYQAYDSNGMQNQKCFLNTIIGEQMLTKSSTLQNSTQSSAQEQVRLAAVKQNN